MLTLRLLIRFGEMGIIGASDLVRVVQKVGVEILNAPSILRLN